MSFRNPVSVTPPGSESDPTTRKIILTAIIIILFVVILIISLHLYSRWYLFRSRRSHLPRSRHVTNTLIFFADPTATTTIPRGLDASVINSLSTFTFSSTANANVVDCAVCLSEFEETESGRVLPNCKHMFHVECIDMWFHSHSTCPLCRAPVVPIVADATLESRVRSFIRILRRDRRVPAVVSPVPVMEGDVELGRGGGREESC